MYTFIMRAKYEIKKLNLLISSSTNLIKTVVVAEPSFFLAGQDMPEYFIGLVS